MPKITNTREITERADPVDIIGRRVPLQRSGNDWNARCPFHSGGQERTPSLHVNPEKGWYCHGPCKRGGTALDFLIEFESLEFVEAVELLASETGMRVQYDATSSDNQDSGPRRHDLHEAVKAAAEHYAQQLADNNGEPRRYAEERGLNEHVRERWQIGYARGNSVKHAADPELLYQAGVLKKDKQTDKQTDKHPEYYDPLAGRLIIPLHDTTGRPIGFTGRALPTNNSSAKYLNTGDTRIYKKSHHLFAYHAAVRHIRAYSETKRPAPVVVEGQLNAIACHEQCIPAVAPGGSTLTERQALLLQRIGKNTLLAYDQDTAGVAATTRAAIELRRLGQDVQVGILGKPSTYTDRLPDPADLAANHEIIGFTEKDLITWAVETLLTERRGSSAWAQQISEHIIPILAAQSDEIIRVNDEKKLASITGLTTEAIRARATEDRNKNQNQPAPQSEQSIDTKLTLARMLCGVVLQMPVEREANDWQRYARLVELPKALLGTLSDIGRVRHIAVTYGIPVTTAIHRLAQAGTLKHAQYLQHWATVELPGPADITGFLRLQEKIIAEEDQRRHNKKELF